MGQPPLEAQMCVESRGDRAACGVGRGGGADKQLDREALIAWAAQRFNAEISLESVRHMQRAELQETLVDLSLASQKRSASHRQWAQEKTAGFFADQTENTRLNRIANEGEIASISLWLRDNVDTELNVEILRSKRR